jgi:hypothetical protein
MTPSRDPIGYTYHPAPTEISSHFALLKCYDESSVFPSFSLAEAVEEVSLAVWPTWFELCKECEHQHNASKETVRFSRFYGNDILALSYTG